MKELNKIIQQILEERYQKTLTEGIFDPLVRAVVRGAESAFGIGAETAAKQAAKQTEKQVAKTIAISAEEQAAKAKTLQDLLHPTTYPLAVVGKQAEAATAKALGADVEQTIKDLAAKGVSDSDAVAQVLEKHAIKDADQMQQVIDKVTKSKTQTALVKVEPKEIKVSKSEGKVETKTLTKTEPETKAIVKTETETKALTKPETKTETETKTLTKPETETKPLTKTETETKTQTKKPPKSPKKPGKPFTPTKFKPFMFGGDAAKKATEMGIFNPSGQAVKADLGLGAEQLGRYSTLYRQR